MVRRENVLLYLGHPGESSRAGVLQLARDDVLSVDQNVSRGKMTTDVDRLRVCACVLERERALLLFTKQKMAKPQRHPI